MLDRVRKLQRAIVEAGLGRNVLGLPAPRTMLIEEHTSQDTTGTTVFSSAVVEAEIISVSRDLFASGHYNISVAEAYKALEKYVAGRVGLDQSGTALMENVFSAKNQNSFGAIGCPNPKRMSTRATCGFTRGR